MSTHELSVAMRDSGLSVADALDKAADLIAAPNAWTQDYHARNKRGEEAEGLADAVCFCAIGAISAALGCAPADEAGSEAHRFLKAVIREPIPDWNDAEGRTQAEVVAALRSAAKLARESGDA